MKPNFIFIMPDQLRYQSIGYAGDKLAQTPNIDKFARESGNFNQAVASMPVCAASRASLMTGKYTSSTGMVINELRMNTNHRCLAHIFTENGYNTAYIGKWHLYANECGSHHKISNAFIPPGPNRLGFDGLFHAYNFHHNYFNAYYFKDMPIKQFYGKKVFEPDAQTDMAIDYLKNHNNSKPFFMILSYGTPHDPWKKRNVPKKWYNRFKHTKFPLPPNYSQKEDPYGDAWSNIEHNPKKLEKWKRVYYAMTANLDWNFGRIMSALKELDLEKDTIVVFTSDHGELFGAHGRMKKNIFYDEAARVPFLVRWLKNIPKGKISNAPFNTVDIMPTLLSLAGLKEKIPKEVEGNDFSSELRTSTNEGNELKSEKEKLPEEAFLMNTGACAIWDNGHEWRGLRNKKYTYAVFRDPQKEYLFQNLEDPYQMNNLADDENYVKILNEFRKKLKIKMKLIDDTFPESTWYREHWIKNRKIKQDLHNCN